MPDLHRYSQKFITIHHRLLLLLRNLDASPDACGHQNDAADGHPSFLTQESNDGAQTAWLVLGSTGSTGSTGASHLGSWEIWWNMDTYHMEYGEIWWNMVEIWWNMEYGGNITTIVSIAPNHSSHIQSFATKSSLHYPRLGRRPASLSRCCSSLIHSCASGRRGAIWVANPSRKPRKRRG